MTPKQREEIIYAVSERVADKLQPCLDSWFEEFENNFIDQFVEVFDGYFEDRMKCYVVDKDEELRLVFKREAEVKE